MFLMTGRILLGSDWALINNIIAAYFQFGLGGPSCGLVSNLYIECSPQGASLAVH